MGLDHNGEIRLNKAPIAGEPRPFSGKPQGLPLDKSIAGDILTVTKPKGAHHAFGSATKNIRENIGTEKSGRQNPPG
jgi:hypothetical protein